VSIKRKRRLEGHVEEAEKKERWPERQNAEQSDREERRRRIIGMMKDHGNRKRC